MWGNSLNVVISPSSKAKTQIPEVLETATGKCYHVKNGSGFFAGDAVAFSGGEQTVYNQVVKCQDNIMTFASEFEMDVTDNETVVPVEFDSGSNGNALAMTASDFMGAGCSFSLRNPLRPIQTGLCLNLMARFRVYGRRGP